MASPSLLHHLKVPASPKDHAFVTMRSLRSILAQIANTELTSNVDSRDVPGGSVLMPDPGVSIDGEWWGKVSKSDTVSDGYTVTGSSSWKIDGVSITSDPKPVIVGSGLLVLVFQVSSLSTSQTNLGYWYARSSTTTSTYPAIEWYSDQGEFNDYTRLTSFTSTPPSLVGPPSPFIDSSGSTPYTGGKAVVPLAWIAGGTITQLYFDAGGNASPNGRGRFFDFMGLPV